MSNHFYQPVIQTASGKMFPICQPSADDIDIEDIAHSLSKLPRFNGHTKGDNIYSVAQHAVMVSHYVPYQHAMQALHHDDPEAYIGDVSSPLKHSGYMEGYKEIEQRIWEAVADHFFVDYEIHESVHEADRLALVTESHQLMAGLPLMYGKLEDKPFDWSIHPLSPKQAKELYLRRHDELERERVQFLTEEFESLWETPALEKR